MRLRIVIASLVLLVVPLALAACGGGGKGDAVSVVASTNVYGDIAQQIGGSHVAVTSILTNPDADPHLFEPGTANGLAVARADVVIENGAGYDTFVQKLEHAAPSGDRIVVTIADALGVHGKDANPHLWYDLPELPRIAAAIAGALLEADPSHAADYRTRLRRFVASLAPLQRELRAVRRASAGEPVAYTEPVAGYLLAAAGLRNLAPTSFTRSIENGTEPPPAAVSAMDALMTQHRVDALIYNSQAVSPITVRVRSAAERAGIPVIGMTETLPPHRSFQQWQLGQLRSLARALAG